MTKRYIAVLAALLIGFSLLFTACKGDSDFEKVDPASTAPPLSVKETESAAEEGVTSKFVFASRIRMGMQVEEVQRAIGQVSELTIADGRKSFSNEFQGTFLKYETTKPVVFMFDAKTERLEQLQFRGNTNADGLSTAGVKTLFKERYGKSGAYQGNRYLNYIWKAEDVYVLLSEVDENSYVVTFTDAAYFETHYKEELAAYNRAK